MTMRAKSGHIWSGRKLFLLFHAVEGSPLGCYNHQDRCRRERRKGGGDGGSKEGFLADRGISWLMFLREGRRVGKEGASYFPFYFVH